MVVVGVHAVAYAFPKVKLISTALDEKVNDSYHIIPGVGKPLKLYLFHSVSFFISREFR